MKESLQAIYLHNDSSKFQQLLGFRGTVDYVLNTCKDEVFEDVEVNVNEENGPDDKIWNISNVNATKETESEESGNKFDTETLQCFLCDFNCETEEALKQHRITLHREEEKCSEILNTNLNIQNKEYLHCDKCDTKFKHGGAFRRHKRVKHGEDEEEVEKKWKILQQNFQWPCAVCGIKFLDQHNLRIHVKRNHSVDNKIDKQETNEIIEEKRKQEKKRIREERKRIRLERRVVCERCSKSVLAKHIKKHIKIHEKKNFAVAQDFNCTMCAMGKYRTEESLQRHVFKCHSGLVYKCELCDHTSTSPHAKRKHIETHHKEKTLPCNECDKRFVGKAYLNAHMKYRHDKVKDRKCPHCDEAFHVANSRSFKAHVNRHTENRQFSCETCGKSFLVHSHLKEHEKRHTLPYFCDKCDLRFGQDGRFKEHIRMVHEQRQVQCKHITLDIQIYRYIQIYKYKTGRV